MTKEEYNELPVHYCQKCLSLAILRLNSDETRSYGVDYCKECGSTMVAKTHIGVWEDMFIDRYDIAYMDSKF